MGSSTCYRGTYRPCILDAKLRRYIFRWLQSCWSFTHWMNHTLRWENSVYILLGFSCIICNIMLKMELKWIRRHWFSHLLSHYPFIWLKTFFTKCTENESFISNINHWIHIHSATTLKLYHVLLWEPGFLKLSSNGC